MNGSICMHSPVITVAATYHKWTYVYVKCLHFLLSDVQKIDFRFKPTATE